MLKDCCRGWIWVISTTPNENTLHLQSRNSECRYHRGEIMITAFYGSPGMSLARFQKEDELHYSV